MSKPSKRTPIRPLRMLLMLLTGLVVYLTVSLGSATFPLAMALHNTSNCPKDAAMTALQQHEVHWKALMAGNKMRKISETPDGLQEWTTPMGDFWAPAKTWVQFVVSEQMLRIYGDGPRRV